MEKRKMRVVYPVDYRFKPDWAGMWERGIREAWANQMIIKHGSIDKAWDNYAKEYEEGEIKYSNRAHLIDRIVKSRLNSVLDIGGGTGVFAIPLAKLVRSVVVVEPSKGMCEILRGKAKKEQLDNITIIQQKWEDTVGQELMEKNEGGPFDVVLASHSLYYITDLHNSFLKMNHVAKDYVYLFTGCSGQMRDPEYERLYLILHEKPLPPYPDYSCIYMVLREVGIQPNIEMIDAKVKRPIKDIQELIDKWKGYLGSKELTQSQEEALRDYLSKKIRKEGDQSYYCYEYKNALIYWRKTKSVK